MHFPFLVLIEPTADGFSIVPSARTTLRVVYALFIAGVCHLGNVSVKFFLFATINGIETSPNPYGLREADLCITVPDECPVQ